MANIPYPQWYPSALNCEIQHAPSIECEVGDLCYYDSATGTVKPASSFTWTTDLVTTQTAFQAVYLGIADSRQLATDAVSHYSRVLFDIIADMPCVSATFAVGDMVGPNGAASALDDQILIKTATAAAAIGKVIRRYATATTRVKVRLVSMLLVPWGKLP